MHNHQLIYVDSTQIMKSSYTRQLANLTMLGSDSKTTQIFPNIHNLSLISLRKPLDNKYEEKLTKNQHMIHRDNTPIIIIPRSFKTGMHVIELTQPMIRN